MDVQRGRDHGLPGYVEYRKYIGLPDVRDFDDLKDSLAQKVRKTAPGERAKTDESETFRVGLVSTFGVETAQIFRYFKLCIWTRGEKTNFA